MYAQAVFAGINAFTSGGGLGEYEDELTPTMKTNNNNDPNV